jgi:DegV family protein with EDD domain
MHSKLNGYAWFHAICSGAEHLIEHCQVLNKINVFPVADGDTGNNLTSLMRSVIQYAKPAQGYYHTALSIAKASLMGARGNSGTIFSQFFYGLVTQTPVEELTLEEFCILVRKAADSAKQAVDHPINGTILSVMEEWARACEELKHQANTIAELIQKSLAFAHQALTSTTDKLEALKHANVVDAGAQGFVYFLEGIVEYFKNPEARKKRVIHLPEVEEFDVDHEEMAYPELRYCTEALICDSSLPLDQIKHAVADLGDSMVIAGNQETCRLHIHTNNPQEVMWRLQALGKIEQQKADDMLRQYEMTQHKTRKVAIVTDSTADIPLTLIDQYQIHVIPLQLQVDQSFYLDKLTITSEHIYDLMRDENRKHTLTTSMPNPALVERSLRQIQAHYDEIIILTIADKLSGTLQIMKSSAEKLGIKHIHFMDSIRTTAALGLLVLEAAKMIDAGKSVQAIMARMEALKSGTNIYVAVNDLQYMIRSGRLSKVKGHVVQALKLKPIVSMDTHGKGIVAGKAFGFRAALDRIVQIAEENKSKLIDYAIIHADTKGIAELFAKKLETVLGKPPLYTMPVSAVIGIHAGPGCCAIAMMLEPN